MEDFCIWNEAADLSVVIVSEFFATKRVFLAYVPKQKGASSQAYSVCKGLCFCNYSLLVTGGLKEWCCCVHQPSETGRQLYFSPSYYRYP